MSIVVCVLISVGTDLSPTEDLLAGVAQCTARAVVAHRQRRDRRWAADDHGKMRAMRGDSITRTRVGAGRGTGIVSERVSNARCMRGPYMLMRTIHCIAAWALYVHIGSSTRWYARGMLAACRVACSLACWCMQLHIRMLMARSCIPYPTHGGPGGLRWLRPCGGLSLRWGAGNPCCSPRVPILGLRCGFPNYPTTAVVLCKLLGPPNNTSPPTC